MTHRAARGASRAVASGALGRSRRLKSKPRWFANTGAIVIAAIGMLRSAAKAVASSKPPTATSGASPPFGVSSTDTTAAAKKNSTTMKYFCGTLPLSADFSAEIRGFQSSTA